MRLTEAFRALDALNEDTFSFSEDGIKKLAEFEQNDDSMDELSIIDLEAETEEDFEDSYIGKIIVDCCVCHSKIYKNKEDLEIDEESGLTNVGEECPYCYTPDGFKIVGEVVAYSENVPTEEDDDKEDNDDVKSDDDIEDTDDEEEINEGIFSKKKKPTQQPKTKREEKWEVFDQWHKWSVGEYDTKAEAEEAAASRGDDGRYRVQLVTKSLKESKSINEDKSLEGTIKLTDDFYYDNVQNIKDADWDEVIELFEENGWVSGNNMIIPEGTRLRKVDHNLYYNFYEIVGSSNSEKIPILIEQENDIPHVAFENEEQPKPRNKKNKLKCPDCGTVSTRQECEREDEDDGPYLACPVCDTILYESKSIKEGMNWTNGEEEYEIDSTLASAPINSIIFIKKSYGGKNRTLKFEKVSTDKWDSLNKFNDRTGSYESDKSLKDKYIDGATWKLEKAVNESKSIQESVNNVNVETDDSIVNVSSDENGKVTVTTEPVDNVDTGSDTGEMVAPISPETENEIMNTSTSDEDSIDVEEPTEGEEVDLDIDEIDEESFDDLGEQYFKENYENVKSFKTVSVKELQEGLLVEGTLTFDSGNVKKTSFVFESKNVDKNNNVTFLVENKEMNTGKSFTVNGNVKDKKLFFESLDYKYATRDSKGNINKVSGTVKRG